MRTIKIERGGRIIIDNSPVEINQLENKSEFLSGILMLDIELSSEISVADIIHFFYDAKDLIRGMMSDEYEVVRAIVTSASLSRPYKSLRIHKSFRIEKEILEDNQEFIYLIPEIELVPSEPGEDGIRNIGGLPIVLDEEIQLIHEDSVTGSKVNIKSKAKITLLDLMTCIFDELPALVKEGLVLSH